MVVGNLDIGRACGSPVEADSPLVVDTNAVLSFSVAMESFESIPGRRSEVIDGFGSIENQQLAVRGPLQGGSELSYMVPFPDVFGAFVCERPDHATSITRSINNCKRYDVIQTLPFSRMSSGVPHRT